MGSAVQASGARHSLTQSLFRAVDRPARETLDLSRRPAWETLAPALLGLFLIARASTAAAAITPHGFSLGPNLEALRAIFEALVVVVPGTTVFAAYLRLRLTPRIFLGATALGLLSAGLVATCILPLMAFLVLVSTDAPAVLALPALLVPTLSLITLTLVPFRVLTALDASRRARWLACAFAFFLFAVFALRMNAALYALFQRGGITG